MNFKIQARITARFLTELTELILKFMIKSKGPRIAKILLKEMKKLSKLFLSDIKVFIKQK